MSKKTYQNIHSQLALPFLETNREFFKELFEILELKFGLKKHSKQQFIDLGSGDGRVILYAALNYGIISTVLEINESLVQEAKKNVRLVKTTKKGVKKELRKIKIIHRDFFQFNLEKYDYVYIFSLPTMNAYLKHVFLALRIGTVIISYKYPLNHEIFAPFLKLRYTLEHESEISTYFYLKF